MMLADLASGQLLQPTHPAAEEALAMVQQQQPEFFSYDDWLKLDELEVSRGQALGRPRLKFTTVSEMLAARASWR
jgi:ferredoxin--NADP+ reductase